MNVRTREGDTALHIAARFGHDRAIAHLFQAAIHVDALVTILAIMHSLKLKVIQCLQFFSLLNTVKQAIRLVYFKVQPIHKPKKRPLLEWDSDPRPPVYQIGLLTTAPSVTISV